MHLNVKENISNNNNDNNNNNATNSNEANGLTFVYLIWPLSSGNHWTHCQEGRKLCN